MAYLSGIDRIYHMYENSGTPKDSLDIKRPVFVRGEVVNVGPFLVQTFDSELLKQILEKLHKEGIDEFAIDVVVDSDNNELKVHIDSESRKFRKLRQWELPRPSTPLMDLSKKLSTEIFTKIRDGSNGNPDGVCLDSRFHRLTIELTFHPAGASPRAYDLAPHIDALSAYRDFPVVEVLFSDDAPTVLYRGQKPWEDTTAFEQSIEGLQKVNVPKGSLSASRGATLIHGAPITDKDRWLLRCFIEPVSHELANSARLGLGRDLSFRTRELA